MTYISHLVVNGCSFTYGSELADPINEAWPNVLAKKIGVPLVNLARPGIGNDTICRRTHEYFYEDLLNHNNPFYIIGFTAFSRQELWHERGKSYRPTHAVRNHDPCNVTSLQKEYLVNYNDLELYKRTMLCKISLKNLFDAYNIPYLLLEMLREKIIEDEMEETCIAKFSGLFNEIKNNPKNLGYITNKLVNPSSCKDGHYDAITNEQIANVIKNSIDNQYTLKVINDKNFVTMRNFVEKFEPSYLRREDNGGVWL